MRNIYPIFVAILLISCRRVTTADILVKPFLESYYDTGISIISGEMDSLYCPVMTYRSILEEYKSLNSMSEEEEAALYQRFKAAESGDPNMLGMKVRYKRADKKGEVFDETLYFDGGKVKYWGLNVAMDRAMIESRHKKFTESLRQK